MSNDYYDFIDRTKISECCGVSIIFEDICSECKEYCSMVKEEQKDYSSRISILQKEWEKQEKEEKE